MIMLSVIHGYAYPGGCHVTKDKFLKRFFALYIVSVSYTHLPVSPRASRLHAAAVIPMTCLNCFEKYAASGYPTSCPMVFT